MGESSSFYQDSNVTPAAMESVSLLVASAETSATNAVNAATNATNSALAASVSATNALAYVSGFSIGTVTVGTASATITGSPGSLLLNLVLPTITPPTPTVLGGVFQTSAGANKFVTGVNSSGTLTSAQPSFANLSGAIAPSQIPAPTTSTLGGVESATAAANQFQTGINSSGSPTFAQPSFSNLSGVAASAQLPAASSGNLGAVIPDVTQAISNSGLLPDAVGFRNRLINGLTNVDQRNGGAAQTFTAGSTLAYCIDGYYGYCTGANVTGQRVANAGIAARPTKYAYQFTGAASNLTIGFGQRIRGVDSYDLAGQTISFSVLLANSLLNVVTWTAYYASSTDAFGTLASPTKTQIATGTFAVSSSLALYSTQIAIQSAATNGIEIVLSVAGQVSGTWTIGGLQVELGSVVTPIERLPFGTELLRCFVFCWKSYDLDVAPGTANTNSTAIQVINGPAANSYLGVYIPFPVPMWTAPTITNYSPNSGTINKCYTASSGDGPVTTINVGTKCASQNVNNNNCLANTVAQFHIIVKAEL